MTLGDVRNKFSEMQWIARKNPGLTPTMLHVVFQDDGKAVQNAQIWAEQAVLWSFPNGWDSGLGKASGDVPWRQFDLSYKEEDNWRIKPAYHPI